jgi:hypothetical protein
MSRLLTLGAGGNSGPVLWTPQAETGLKAWFDMTNPASYSGGTWTKRWGSLNNFVADSTGPSVITNGFSGDKDALVFNGNSDVGMQIASPGEVELMMVFVLNVTTVNAGVFPTVMNRSTLGAGVQSLQILENYGLSAKYGSAPPAEEYTATLPGQLLLVCSLGDYRAIRNNGVLFDDDSTTPVGTTPASTASIYFARYLGSATNWVTQVAAIGVFTAASWSTGLAEKIEGYVAHNNIGVTTAILPGGHTYKTNAPTV